MPPVTDDTLPPTAPDPGHDLPPPMPSSSSPSVCFTLGGNARVDQPFALAVEAKAAAGGEPPAIEILDVHAPPQVMDEASFEPATRMLRGTPRQAGEMALTVTYRLRAEAEAEAPAGPATVPPPTLEAPLALFVNADPRALWKNLPSDASGPDAKPDTAAGAWAVPPPPQQAATFPRWLLAASQRGRSHAHTGAWRDDDFAVSVDGAWQIVAVADGAGSASRSRRGAELAVAVARDHMRETLSATSLDELAAHFAGGEVDAPGPEPGAEIDRVPAAVTSLAFRALGHAAYQALKAIHAEAQSHESSPRDYSTTLLLAAHACLPGETGHLYLAFQVGDGAIGVYTPDAVTLLGTPDAGAYAGQTRFLDAEAVSSTEAIRARLGVHRRRAFAPLLVMTDGVSDPYFESDAALHDAGAWQRLWESLAPVIDREQAAGVASEQGGDGGAQLAEWLNFFTPGHHDDRTLVVLV